MDRFRRFVADPSAASADRNAPAPLGTDDDGLFRSRWLFVTIALAIALVLRLAIVWKTEMIGRDGQHYVSLAMKFNDGQWLTIAEKCFLFNPYLALVALLAQSGISYDIAGQLVCAVGAALAVLPLHAWCRSAFNRRIAECATALYVFHPVLLRTSGQVFREGIYWLFMLGAIAVLWSAMRRISWWRFVVGGMLATAATLTRNEGAAVFVLAALWWLLTPSSDVHWKPWLRRGAGVALAAGVLPITLLLLNVTLIPRGHGWQGATPQVNLGLAPEIKSAEVRPLAQSLPVWTANGGRDPAQQKLQYFLIMADDQRVAIYFSKFISQVIQSFQAPVLVWFLFGFGWCRWAYWRRERDLPLVIQSLLLAAFMLHHLSTDHVLEVRYMFCLIPLILPWAGIGMIESYVRLRAWFGERNRAAQFPAHVGVVVGVLLVLSIGKGFNSLGNDKLPQRHLGERLRTMADRRLVIAGPESFRRVAFYANSDYRFLPKGETQNAAEWLKSQQIDFVVAVPEDSTWGVLQNLERDPSQRYKRVLADDPRFRKFKVFQVLSPTAQLGS